MKQFFVLLTICLTTTSLFAQSNATVRKAAGADAAAIQTTVDQFRTDLGGANNGIGNTFTTGRREINWDGVPDNFAQPNNLPAHFFNVNSARGVVFKSRSEGQITEGLRVSADSDNPTTTALEFSDLNATFDDQFAVFSPQRLFSFVNSTELVVKFFVPGTSTPASVRGFGAVFTDVDMATVTSIEAFKGDKSLGKYYAQPAGNGLSFVGVSYPNAVITKVVLMMGNKPVVKDNVAGQETEYKDIVVMDDFIYGEPKAVAE